MIVKAYSKSIHLEAMEMLLKRLSVDHPIYSKISNQIGTTRAGDIGEEMVFRELEKMKLPFKYYVFHKLLLFAENAFELDILLITPFGAIILEVKNFSGILEFTGNPSQIIQHKESGEINKYPCPAAQLNEYKYQLLQFFNDQNIPIPIYGAVVFASRKSFVKITSDKAEILYRNEVSPFLRKFQKLKPTLTEEDMEKIKDILLQKNTPFAYFPLSKHFSIQSEDIIRGVECNRCGYLGMQKRNRTWYCPSCRKNDSSAYKNTITSYFLLCKDSITNKECRDFLLLSNRHEAKRILANSNLIKTGNNKSTIYKIKHSL
ncbi:nuclease-related domain-containing protein [Psychrobacillus sp. OK032]|uniref:nuclease-related domain-containing protein n=1 Tax=Psychrobacillus sp. OK032 TaxID=1884358 RepID=UPI0008B26A1A|nr:nuclease-related domain-containing protein [Psychrobacillus sp. OK032]SES16860.1 Nuclease-related domain-containing protein [Psychrobacillus sp. OK032]